MASRRTRSTVVMEFIRPNFVASYGNLDAANDAANLELPYYIHVVERRIRERGYLRTYGQQLIRIMSPDLDVHADSHVEVSFAELASVRLLDHADLVEALYNTIKLINLK